MKNSKILSVMSLLIVLTVTGCGNNMEEIETVDIEPVLEEVMLEEVMPEEEEEAEIQVEAPIEVEEVLVEDSLDEAVVQVEVTDEDLMAKVTGLAWAQNMDQIVLVVETEGSRARFLFIEKEEGQFGITLSTLAWIGSNGMGKTMEGDCKTPAGVYTLSHPFGRNDDPGCTIPYVKLDDSWYWVEDGNSIYYNQMVTTNEVEMDWTEAEQLNTFGYSYNYSIAIDYNIERTPGVGSAIFLHCTHDSPTRGCVAIEEDLMIRILQKVEDGAVIALYDSVDAIW